MDFSAANTSLWNIMLQMGLLSGILLVANILRRKIPFVEKTLLPTAVIAGFIALFLRAFDWFPVKLELLEIITYHSIAIGFIALSLQVPEKRSGSGKRRSGSCKKRCSDRCNISDSRLFRTSDHHLFSLHLDAQLVQSIGHPPAYGLRSGAGTGKQRRFHLRKPRFCRWAILRPFHCCSWLSCGLRSWGDLPQLPEAKRGA